jgi:hypothetical protein
MACAYIFREEDKIMKNSIRFLISMVLVLGMASASLAATIYDEWRNDGINPTNELVNGDPYAWFFNSGTLVNVYNIPNAGGDPQWDALIAAAAGDGAILVERLGNTDVQITGYNNDGTLIWNSTNGGSLPSGADSGTWQVISPLYGTIYYYAIWGSSMTALYKLDPFANYGAWSTFDLWVERGLGDGLNISGFRGINPGPPIPEPSTLMLLGVGILGLAFYGRRRMKS